MTWQQCTETYDSSLVNEKTMFCMGLESGGKVLVVFCLSFGRVKTKPILCHAKNMTLNKDSCSGDAGGPVICSKSHEYYGHELELKGLVSWGLGCGAPGYPGVYTKVFPFIDWIRTQTEQFNAINDITHIPFFIQGPFVFELIKLEVLHMVKPVLTTSFDLGVEYWKRIGLKKSLKSFGQNSVDTDTN